MNPTIHVLSAALLALAVNTALAAEPAATTEPAATHEHGNAGAEAKGEPAAKGEAKDMDCGKMHKKHHRKKGCAGMMDKAAKEKPAK